MFILNKDDFGDSDLKNAKEFVEFWSSYYQDTIKTLQGEKISYLDELNINNELTKKNVKRLLRWKDPHMLTEIIRSGPNKGKENKRVTRVLDELNSLNEFRNNQLHEDDFLKIVKKIFNEGLIWQVFLFHIARPYEFPIADQYVFRVFSTITKEKTPGSFEEYKKYKGFFFNVAKYAGIISQAPKGNEENICDIVARLKKLDNAFFTFGKFLKTYDR